MHPEKYAPSWRAFYVPLKNNKLPECCMRLLTQKSSAAATIDSKLKVPKMEQMNNIGHHCIRGWLRKRLRPISTG
uniref:Uncharacterized protein MANES_10G017600 n=1 Tax=Rhizophora mucronata TaxID=61149 RepID=A0A2P2KTM8_RHIMU